MQFMGRSIGAGDTVEVFHGARNAWEVFKISDWSEGTGDIYGRLETKGDKRGYSNLQNTYGANVRWPVAAKVKVKTSRFTPWPKLSSRYGAPMGRVSRNPGFEDLAALAASGPAGEYDAGGAYWGTSASEGPVWAVWAKGKGAEGVVYVRAKSRDGAMRAALDA
jgi:hypothetical protein